MCIQKGHDLTPPFYLIFCLTESMPLIWKEDILYRHAIGFHAFNHFVGLNLKHPWILSSLKHDYRIFDLIGMK